MFDVLGRYWRVVGTGLSFAAFGAGGLVLRVLVFPVLSLFVWKNQLRQRLARLTIRLTFRLFIGLMHWLGVLRYDFIGLEKLDRHGLLILANHPSLIDTVFLMAFVKNADCVIKAALWHNPFTHGPVRAAGYIMNNNGLALIDDCVASLDVGGNLIIFPEGTRTPQNGQIQLKRGAANIAVRGARNITPVIIHCTPPTLSKGEKWWQVPARRVYFRLEVKDDIHVQPFIESAGQPALAARQLTHYLEDYFIHESQTHAVA
ncbi:1-acyl-sn-glycerol-3-phosphate acyltransferase [Chitinivorax tropicus]|uniref:1-acyl-sn-glycerol-3-phosphate acyltransferase n=1 Tax=Chitinivorax tropicus TaxID=714531 RepID=A0A840MLN0_9PROT|nr:lysophospholipid acyltransferase family protein [Chitinivorax tropicus]MBB5017446.1 1-acyl-sn-glycerol-3-phosphate acyltransferase [Chitinivorax tropicus]